MGSEGLTLIETSTIILCEPWYNSTTIEQAKARVLRIGQTKNVKIFELVIQIEGCSNIEERMLKLCQDKQKMTNNYLGQKKQLSSNILENLLK